VATDEIGPEALVAAATAAARSARRAAAITLIAVSIALVVLAIDHTIKRDIVRHAEAARRIFTEFQQTAAEAASGFQATGPGAADSGDGPDPLDGVVYAPGAPAAPDPDAGRSSLPAGRHTGRPDPGARGDE
jgi:hypothetical protein